MKKLTFFQNNRFFLVASLLMGLILPLLAPLLVIDKPEVFAISISEVSTIEVFSLRVKEKSIDWHTISKLSAKLIYLLGVSFMLLRLVNGLKRIFLLYKSAEKVQQGELIFAYNDKPHLPFSFMNVIFLSRNVDFGEKINKVITHEIAHVKQWHSIDVLITEILQVFFWFNPVLIFYKKSLKDAHEYIADRTVVSQSDYKEYIHLLLQTSTTPLEAHLVNSFFNSQIKNRIVMLNINKSNKKAVLRYAIIIPMIGVFTYLLASSKFVSNLAYEGQAKSIDSIPMLPPPPPPPPLPPIPSDAKWVNNQVTANGFTYIIEGPNVGENFDLNEWSTYIESFSAKPNVITIHLKDKKVNYTRSDNPINIELDNINRSYFSKDYPIGKWKNSKLRMGEFTYDILNYDAQEDFNLDEWDAMIVEDPSRKHFSIYLQGLKNDYVRNLNGKNVQLPGIYKPEYIQTIWTNSKLTFNNIHYTIKNKEVNGVFDLRDWKFDMVHDEKNSKVDITLIEKKQDKIQSNIPPPPPPSPAKKDEIFQIVEEMPRFPGCEDLKGTILDKEECAKRRLMSYLGQNVAYPVEARNGNIQGQSVVQFTVKADGSIGDVLVLRDPGSGLGNAAKDVVMSMNNMKEKWTPGKQKGQFVNVQYTVPIKFKLADIESNDKTEDITRGIVVVGHGNPAIKPSTPPPPLPPPTAIWKNSKTVSDGREYEIIKMNVNGMIDLSKYGFNTLWKIGGNKVTIDILGLKNSSENSNSVPPPPPPPPPKEELFKIVEEMPRFPGCEELDGSIKDKEACAKEKLLQYIGNIVKYPNEAKANGIEGQAVIQFIIKKDGSIDDVEVLRDPGAGLGKAAKEAVLSMNQMPEKWIAGKQRGVKVAVQYTIPVKFKLNDDKDDYSKIDASHPQKISSAQSIKGVSNLENVLIILDGKVLPQSKEDALSKIDPSTIKSIDVQKSKESIARYTDKPDAYARVIIVTTKNGDNSPMKKANVLAEDLKVSKAAQATLPQADEYFVDGQLVNKLVASAIAPSHISAVEVIKETKEGKVVSKILIETKSPKESPNALSLKVYPNPSPKDRVNIVLTSKDTKTSATIRVYDVSGKLLHTQSADLKTGNTYLELNLEGKAINTSQVLIIAEQGKEMQLAKLALN